MPTATASPEYRAHVLPDPKCPGCGAQRRLVGGAVFACEFCRTETPLPAREPGPAPVANDWHLDDVSGPHACVLPRPEHCLRCNGTRVARGNVFVCPGCGSLAGGGQVQPPEVSNVHTEPPTPRLPEAVRLCMAPECKRAPRDLRLGKLVCPRCGDAVPFPEAPPAPAPRAAEPPRPAPPTKPQGRRR